MQKEQQSTTQQVAVSDKQVLKSMIPHHDGAILMCENADLKDTEIRGLCEQSRSGQRLRSIL